ARGTAFCSRRLARPSICSRTSSIGATSSRRWCGRYLAMPRKLTPDPWLFGVVVALCSIGVVMVYSSSAIIAADRLHDPFFFLKKQLFWAVVGFGFLWIALRADYRRLERLVVPLLVVSFVLLVLVLVPPFGQAINGTRRWFRGGPFSFQPVELA